MNLNKKVYLFPAMLLFFNILVERVKYRCEKDPLWSQYCLIIKLVTKNDEPPTPIAKTIYHSDKVANLSASTTSSYYVAPKLTKV